MHTYQSEPDQVLEITFSAASAAADAATASSCSLGPPPPSIIPRPSPLPPVTSTLERLVNGGASGGTRAAWLHVHSHPPTRTHRVYLAGNHAASDGRNGLAVLHTFLEELGRAVVPGAGGAPGAALVRSSAGGGLLCGGGGLEEGPASSATTQPRSPPPPPPRRPPIPDAFLPRPAGPVRGDGSHWATALATAEEDAQRAGTGAPSAPFAPPPPYNTRLTLEAWSRGETAALVGAARAAGATVQGALSTAMALGALEAAGAARAAAAAGCADAEEWLAVGGGAAPGASRAAALALLPATLLFQCPIDMRARLGVDSRFGGQGASLLWWPQEVEAGQGLWAVAAAATRGAHRARAGGGGEAFWARLRAGEVAHEVVGGIDGREAPWVPPYTVRRQDEGWRAQVRSHRISCPSAWERGARCTARCLNLLPLSPCVPLFSSPVPSKSKQTTASSLGPGPLTQTYGLHLALRTAHVALGTGGAPPLGGGGGDLMTHAHSVAGRLAVTHSAQGFGPRLADMVAGRTGRVLKALACGSGSGLTVADALGL